MLTFLCIGAIILLESTKGDTQKEMSIDNNTHNNENMCKNDSILRKVQEDVFVTNYNGDLVVTTRDNYTKLCGNLGRLEKQVGVAKETIVKKNEEIKELRSKNLMLQQENAEQGKLLADYKHELERLKAQLGKFTANQQGRKSKLDARTKEAIKQGLMQNMSITEIYETLVKNGFSEASYETIRRYCAGLKKNF